MRTITLPADISVAFVTAQSFPEGVAAAQQKLHSIFPPNQARTYYGISRPEGAIDHIVYKAAVSESFEGEAVDNNCGQMIIPAGDYYCIEIRDYMKKIPAIGEAFQKLLGEPGIDEDGFCLEWYEDEVKVKCLVPRAK